MIRLIGILLGSVVAVAALILLVGIPQMATPPNDDLVEIQLPLMPEAVDEASTAAAEPQPTLPEPAPPEPAPISPPPPVDIPADDVLEMLAELEEPEIAEVTGSVAADPPVTELRWYAFWSPFRSQIAANGFVEQLSRVTGLDYRVVNVKPGVYEVAFGYTDDDEIQANLSQISAATGLDMPES